MQGASPNRSKNSNSSASRPDNVNPRGVNPRGRAVASAAGRGRGSGGQAPRIAPRVSAKPAQIIGTPIPEPLAGLLSNLKYQLDTLIDQTRISAASLKPLHDVLEQLHNNQSQIETVLRLHAGQEPLGGLRQSLFRFVQKLDEALQGKPSPKVSQAAVPPARDRLPLGSLGIDDIEKLCLGLSSLAYSRSHQPFPYDRLGAAGEALSSLTKKLMDQLRCMRGEKAIINGELPNIADMLSNGQLLNIGNMVRRFLAADLIDIRSQAQQMTLVFLKQEFQTFCNWAEKGHTLDKAHDLGKTASQILTMLDCGIVTDVNALAKVLAWLLGPEALAQMHKAGNTVALSSVISLVTRLLQGGRFKTGNRDLDVMWSRLCASIGALDAQAMVGSDGRTLASHSNLIRVMLKKELPQAWQQALAHMAKGKPDNAKNKTLLNLLSQFNAAIANILGAIGDVAFERVDDLHSLSNLVSFVKSLHELKCGVDQEILALAATRLVEALPKKLIVQLCTGEQIGGLFKGLQYLYEHGLSSDQAKLVQCLLDFLPVIAASTGWDDWHANQMVDDALLKIMERDQVNENDKPLQAALKNLLGPAPHGKWSAAALRSRDIVRPSRRDEDEVPLRLDQEEDDASLHARCTRPPELVGGTLAQVQQLAPISQAPAQGPVLPHALTTPGADQFRAATRLAREPQEDAAPSLFPIPVLVEDDAEDEVFTTTTTNTTTTTTTTSTTRVTTTTAIGGAPVTSATTAAKKRKGCEGASKKQFSPKNQKETTTSSAAGKPNEKQEALASAILAGETEVVKSLLKSGAAAGLSIHARRDHLRKAVWARNPDVLDALLAEKTYLPALDATDPMGQTLLMLALDLAASRFVLSEEERKNSLAIASRLIAQPVTREQAMVHDQSGKNALSTAVSMKPRKI